MNIFIIDRHAFIRVSDDKLMCIGTEDEVTGADEKKVWELVVESIAISYYQGINSSRGITLH